MVALLMCLVSVNADLTTDNQAYYSFDSEDTTGTTMIDLSSNGNNGTCINMGGDCNTVPGLLINASNFTTTQAINLPNVFTTSSTITFSAWFNPSLANNHVMLSAWDVANERVFFQIRNDGTNFFRFSVKDGTTTSNADWNVQANVSQWYHLVGTYDGTNTILYVNGAQKSSVTGASGAITSLTNWDIGGLASDEIEGQVDEVAIYNRTLNSTEVLELYNSGAGFNPYGVGPTPQIQTNLSTYYNTSNISVLLTTTSNVNMSVIIDSDPELSIANNTNSTITNLTGFTEGQHNFSWISKDANGNNTNNESAIFDFTAPVISIIGNITQNQFEVNFSTIFNVTDALSGLASCTINITYLENITNASQHDRLINCTDTETFTAAGLYNGFLEALDNAGNKATLSVNGTINPVVNVFFNDTSNSSIIKGYTAIVTIPNNGNVTFPVNPDGSISISPVFNGTLTLGNYTIYFSKLGYGSANFILPINETSGGTNVTFDITRATIVLTIFDRQTNQPLTGLTNVQVIATVGFNSSTTTGFLNITDLNFISETYQLLAAHTGYATENVFFTYTNQEILPVNVYMLALNATTFGTTTVKTIATNGLFIKGATCSLLEWRAGDSAYSTVAQGITDVDGEVTFNIELGTKIYKALCVQGTLSKEQLLGNGGVISTTGLVTPIYLNILEPSLDYQFEDVLFSFTNTTVNTTHQRLTFTWNDANNLVSKGCIVQFRENGLSRTKLTETCVSSSASQIQVITNINNSFDLIGQAQLFNEDDLGQNVGEIKFLSTESFEGVIEKYHLDLIIPILFFFLGLGLGLVLDPQNIYISLVALFILEWVTFIIVPTTISFTTVTFISVILGTMIWGVYSGRR